MISGACRDSMCLYPSQVLFELLTWRLPWTFADMAPFKVRLETNAVHPHAHPCSTFY